MEIQKRMDNWMPFPDFDRTKPFSVPGKVRGMTSYYPAAAHECRSQLAYQHAAHTSELDSPLADRSRNLFADESKLKLEQSKQPGRANQRIVPFSKGPQARKEAKEQRKKGNLTLVCVRGLSSSSLRHSLGRCTERTLTVRSSPSYSSATPSRERLFRPWPPLSASDR